MTSQPEHPPSESSDVAKPRVKGRSLLKRTGQMLSKFWSSEESSPQDNLDSNELAKQRTSMAKHRTLMAADRTLMAWMRTALSMISFGFTIYKILQGFQHSGDGLIAPKFDPQSIGLFLVGLGTFSMMMGTIEYWQTLKELRLLRHRPLRRPSFVISLVMAVLGMSTFLSIVTGIA